MSKPTKAEQREALRVLREADLRVHEWDLDSGIKRIGIVSDEFDICAFAPIVDDSEVEDEVIHRRIARAIETLSQSAEERECLEGCQVAPHDVYCCGASMDRHPFDTHVPCSMADRYGVISHAPGCPNATGKEVAQ